MPQCGHLFLYKGNTLAIFHCEGKRPVSMVLFMIQAKEVATIGPASFRSRHEMLSRPVALFGDNVPSNFNTSVAEVCGKLNVVETGFMYKSKLVLPLGSFEARFGPTDVKWSLRVL